MAKFFHIITGEYSPQPGGVGDYSAQVAAGLAARGAEVHVWTTAFPGAIPDVAGVHVHRVAGTWSPGDRARLDAALDEFRSPRRLLVQYTPNVWGCRGMNLGFCRWLAARRRRGDEVRLMFHELFHYFRLRDKPTRWLLPPVHRWMLRTVLKACSQIDVSTLEWARLLGRYRNVAPEAIHWAPVPSNIPVADDPDAVDGLRRRLAPRGERIIGHFGTFSAYQSDWLRGTLPTLLQDHPDRVGLLIGRNGERLAATLAADCPGLEGRLAATGSLDPAAISHHLQACDLLIQPYPDGICSRRTTAMAGLVHSRPVVATRGRFTEPVWTEGTALSAIETGPEGLAQLADHLLNDSDALNCIGASGRALYERQFSLEHTLDALDGSSLLTPHPP